MVTKEVDVLVIGAGPVGLMCAYLGTLSGLNILVIDKTEAPLDVGRADALNARTLQLFEMVGLFSDLYSIGKKCNTSSVWSDGKFLSRESSWWDELQGCFHKHFLMIGQPYIEKLLDEKLTKLGKGVLRKTLTEAIDLESNHVITTLSSGDKIRSKYLIGADGARSFVRERFDITFDIIRPQIVWAVIDGVIETDFEKVPEIIVFQNETSDVAWIPREKNLDRFYVRMDKNDFTIDEVLLKINRALKPHILKFKEIVWFSKFSVKESVAQNFFTRDRIFLAGDSCHIHSVNGGQGLNTGLADAFNLMWKLSMQMNKGASDSLLRSYEEERRPVALSVIETSGELVRSTKYSETNTHAEDYVKIVKKRSGNITGMGIRYGKEGMNGTRVFDFEISTPIGKTRLYSLLDYRKYTLLIFGMVKSQGNLPEFVNKVHINTRESHLSEYISENCPYKNIALLVRPDSYIGQVVSLDDLDELIDKVFTLKL